MRLEFTCGGELLASDVTQTFSNPVNAEGLYDNGLRCKWVIRRPAFSSIVIKLTGLDMEEEANCFDFLVVSASDYTTRFGLDEGEPNNKRYCNKTLIGTEIQEGVEEEVYIYFVADYSGNNKGFTAEYRLVTSTTITSTTEAPTTSRLSDFPCGGELEASSVTQSFSNPVNASTGVYNDDLHCKWVIRAPTSGSIVIKLTEMDAEDDCFSGANGCGCDYLLISATDYTTSEALIQGEPYDNSYCNETQVGTEISMGSEQEFYIYFVTDGSVTFKGFTAEYRLGRP
ncbi:calcium binding EGF domain-containing protein [Aphelenchoides avenae]|nr:calcium binding EGF domain-containing protein [Aphelenchus avenae]KAH7705290.1 calcium binding EGF domain-containing protein [Aphelenchus avenae]